METRQSTADELRELLERGINAISNAGDSMAGRSLALGAMCPVMMRAAEVLEPAEAQMYLDRMIAAHNNEIEYGEIQ